MFTQYISPLDKAKKYLSTQQFDDTDNAFIEEAKKNGYSEDSYLPAIASKKMRAQDAELSSKYTQYKESPTTFMSGLKSQYGEGDKGAIGKAAGFVWNTIMDLGENVEEIGSMAAHPIETAKGLGNIVANPIDSTKAMWGAIKENFGTIEKAKETFYENPFDVLSVLIPVAKLGKVGKLATLAKDASGLSKVSEAAKVGKLGKAAKATAGFMSRNEELIGKLADISNWDINIAKGAAKGIGGAASVGTDFASSLIYGAEGKDVLKNILSRTKTGAGRESLAKYKQMGEEGIIKEFESGMEKTDALARKELDNAAKQSAELTPISGGMVGKNLYKGDTIKAPFQKGGTMFTDYKLGDASAGEYINIGERGVKQSAEALEAQDVINSVMKDMKMPKNWLDNFSPTKSQNVITKLDDAVKGRLKGVMLSENGQNLVKNYIGWMKKAQNQSFPLIKKAREGFSEYTKFADELASETSLSAKRSVIAKRIASAGNKKTLQKGVKYLQTKAGVNLTDMASALASEKLVGRGSMIALSGGALAFFSNPMYLATAIGYTAVTSPAMIYTFARSTGSLRAIKTMSVEKLAGVAKSLKVTPEELRKAMINVYDAPDGKSFVNLAKNLGKGALDRRSLGLVERMIKGMQEQYSNQSDKMKWDISQMDTAMQEGIANTQQSAQPQQDTGELKYKGEAFNL